jgi:hypothetical protein
MNYNVGQILYVIVKKQPIVYPMQVVEEITKKTLNGEETSYILRAGPDPTKTINIAEIDGEIFDSSNAAKRILIERVTKAVAARVDEAISKAKEWYPSGFERASDDHQLSIIKKADDGPSAEPKKPPSSLTRQDIAELAQELRADSEQLVTEVPDGHGGVQHVKVRSVKLPPEIS